MNSVLYMPVVLGVIGLLAAFVIYRAVLRYSGGEDKVASIGNQIHLGAMVFMRREYTYLLIFSVVICLAIWFSDLGWMSALSFAVGAISKGYETFQDGIVVQAVGATIAVVFSMLVLYRTRIIKVTERFRKVVIGATMGIMLLYLVSFLINIFGGNLAFINSPSLLGIGFSILVCGLAAMNLALDFDLIERGVQERFPKSYEWVAALGLVVTIIWLYLELLRLFAKLRD